MTSDWRRKHMCDLAWVSKECERNASLPKSARTQFGDIYMQAKQLASFPGGGNSAHFDSVINLFCSACKYASLAPCEGRFSWNEPCDLIHHCIRVVPNRQPLTSVKIDTAKDEK
jgi:hypothetical protein